MLQFYFLAILLNLITGLILIYADIFSDDLESTDNTDAASKVAAGSGKIQEMLSNTAFFKNKTFLIVTGILACFTGMMKLLSVVRNDIPVIGDLLPALAGLFGGFAVVVAYYRLSAAEKPLLPDFVNNVFVKGHKYIGIFCIVAALLHFVFPGVLFFQPMSDKTSIACIARDGSKVLIAHRQNIGQMANRWEFPGGKIEPGETDEQAIIREFYEEFGVQVKVGRNIAATQFEHNGKTCALHAYEIFVPHNGLEKPYVLTEHTEYKWVELSEIENLNFVDSDLKLYPAVKDFFAKAGC